MSLLDLLSRRECWEDFYEYKTSLACPKAFSGELREYIDRQAYLPVCETIARRDRFPLPRRAVISKMGSRKKRIVYTYPPAENTVLKLLTYLLLRTYDGIFSPGLYSFRPHRTAKDAVRALSRVSGIGQMYAYKVDISNYFNSVPIWRLLPMLQEVTAGDPALYAFLSALLAEPEALDGDRTVAEDKGIMAGTPLSAFYANLYLRELDRHFADAGVPYARYSDDIILFAPSRAETESYAAFIRDFLASNGLTVNPDKEQFTDPAEGWTFLGFLCRDGVYDIAPATVRKLKQKMRRKTRVLARWQKRSGAEPQRAAAAFIRVFNRKLLEGGPDHELTWRHWFFSVINTADSLREIDHYAQDCIRYLLRGRRTKARFNARYADLKKLGYQSLVHAYYDFNESKDTQ
ncbi:MAG: group II intron reverse transcriptase domain-containing protein [Oscillospiraceae bacterium]|nr:group II intron reverse transcriptase domain-containing protein [Oscillospiraceae bacterium]